MKTNILKILTDYRQFQIFVLGILSGMPIVILYSTLSVWMSEAGVSLKIITTFAVATMFYSLKFCWAPFIDRITLPIIGKIGHRKSWMLVISASISVIVFSFSTQNPSESISNIYLLTLGLGFASATLDIVIDAFRIDTIDADKQSLAAANAVFGYRIGMWIISSIGLIIAHYYDWQITFTFIGSLYLAGCLFILTLREPKLEREPFDALTLHSWKVMTIDPFLDFFRKDKALVILLAIIFYKLGDAMLGVIANPFYLELGFTKLEIGVIAKGVGLWATISGLYFGGIIMYKFGHFKGLLICGLAQSLTNISFVWLNYMGHNNIALATTIVIENVAAGMGDAALVGYLSYLCNKQFSATQYALFSSASTLFRHSIVTFGGLIVETIGWNAYFIMTIFLALPGLLLLLYLYRVTESGRNYQN